MDLERFPIVTTRYSASPKRKFSIYVISLFNGQVFDSLAPTLANSGQYCPGYLKKLKGALFKTRRRHRELKQQRF